MVKKKKVVRRKPTGRRQPAHVRQGRVTGNTRQLNAKGLKVLAAIKFSPVSLSREDIADKTSLAIDDVERQVRLLLSYQYIQAHANFPTFPQQGWKVFTARDKHSEIIAILRRAGLEDPRVEHTRQILGDYYPTGMDLEGRGRQPFQGFTYTQGHPIIPELEFRPETIAIMEEFRDRIKPFRPKQFSAEAVEEKKGKWGWFVQHMSAVYGLELPRIEWGEFTEESWNTPGASGSSAYQPATNTLFFTGKFSLVTLLHEFGHVRGFDERDTIIWSINLGMRTFPVTFNRLIEQSDPNTHMLMRNDPNIENFNL